MLITLEVTTNKEITDLEDKIMGRIYSMDGVEDVQLVLTIELEEISDDQVH